MKSEAKIQAELFQKVWNERPSTRRLFFHIPNGGNRSISEAVKFKAMGVIAGVPDMFLAIARKQYNGYFIELKKPGDKPSPKQLDIHNVLRYQGYKVEIFDDVDVCFESINNYLCSPNDGHH